MDLADATTIHSTYTNLDRTAPISPTNPVSVGVGHGPLPDLRASPHPAPKFTTSIPPVPQIPPRPLPLKGKEKELSAKEPLTILDLPVDILREIIAHVRIPINLIIYN
jgi:hypothetical protein